MLENNRKNRLENKKIGLKNKENRLETKKIG
jgi:hypothetical protein